jgi:predicted AAA+ superfamily ATPase
MFYRNIIDYLKEWKDKPGRKPLILRGARQVGKTSAVLFFGEKEFKNTIHINLEKPEHKRLFSEEISLKDFETILNFSLEQKIIPGQTLLFIDEIQETPHLVKLLRFFYEENPNLHVIAAGSLFEVKLKQKGFAIPVGRVEFAYLYPLDFFEYLKATGQSKLLEYLKGINLKRDAIPEALHNQALQAFYIYALIGGMPEAVAKYQQTQDLQTVNSIYSNLFISFIDDIYKYATTAETKYLNFILDQAPLFSGLSITYNKFAGSNYRSREMSQAFDTLQSAMLLYQTQGTKSYKLPLVSKRKKAPKLIFLDVGLVNYRMGIQPEYSQMKNLDGFYRGRIAEQIVGQQLISSFVNQPARFNFWYKNNSSSAEVDFCLAFKGKIVAIEVKSGSIGRLKSAQQFTKTVKNSKVIRVYSGKLQKQKELISLPFYLLPRWKEAVIL